ncbi:MAG: hypothetical protein IK092_07100, partial [Muribaculaceae bacterium]|nr:hypothetical protein [Muribaculaceae bacterium]
KVQELLRLSLADADALKAKPITDFKKVIICHEEQGVKYVPTLFDFLSLKSIELLNGNELSRNLANEIFDNWEAANANNIEPLLFVKEQRVLARSHYGNDDEFTKLYNQYKDTEYSGIFVQHLSNSSSKYALFKDYIERYPNAYYSPAIQNKIYDIEEQKVNLSVKQNVSSRDSLRISITNENVWNYKIKILRLPDTAKPDKDDWYNVKDFELVKAIDCKADADKFPFSKWGEVVMVEPLPYGRYLVIPSFVCKGELQEVVRVSPNDLISVYDIGSFFVSVKGEPKRIYTVDIKTGKPLQGVTVKAKGKEVLGETGADGCLVIPEKLKSASLYLSKGDDKYSPSVSYYKDDYYDRDNSRIGAHVYTDLGIYRPGETVNFNAMFYYADSETRGVLPGEKIRVLLRDANSKPIDTLYLNTDDFGRIEGKFVIPTDRMNGNYTLRFEKQSGYLYSTTQYIVVSEYKTPTFAVEFSNDRYNFVDKEPVKITGNVKTYSGIPLADTEVKLSLSRNEWSWRWWYPERNSKHLNDTIVKTDSNGDFTMEYSPELLGDHYYYSYTVNAMCTDDAGESHEASVNFIVGSRRGLEMASDVNYENDKPIKLPIEYNTTVENEKNVQCYYELLKYNGNELVKSGNFSSDNPVFDFTDVPSGEYRFKAKVLADDDASKISSRLVLYKLTDKSAPVANHPMWIPADRKRVDEKNVAHIYIGTSVPESHIYYIATSRKGKVGEGWLHYKPGIHDLKLQIPNDPEDYVEVKLASTYDFNTYDEELTLNSIVEREKLNITVTSFRDKLIPGTPEKWTFKILNAKNQPMRAAMFLGMTDKAINSIQDNTWSFSRPAISGNFPAYLSTHGYSGTAYNRMYWKERSKEENDFDLPDFNFYDMEPFGIRAYGYDLGGAMPGVLYKSSSKARVESANYMAMEEAAAADFMEDSEMEMDEPNKNLENVEVRDHDVKTALWKPMLVTDANGDINISFDAPNFNTTWFLQAIAYNSDLVNDKFVKDVL